jgi:hypothetical protein
MAVAEAGLSSLGSSLLARLQSINDCGGHSLAAKLRWNAQQARPRHRGNGPTRIRTWNPGIMSPLL